MPLRNASSQLLITRRHGSTAGLSTCALGFERMSSHQNPSSPLNKAELAALGFLAN